MGKRRRAWDEPGSKALLGELAAIYAQVEARYRDHSCPGSTECCRFAVTGREPYVTSVEALAVARAVARRGGKLSPRKRALPLVLGRAERICPLLDATGRCSIYADRPFGCRSFWCERTSRDTPVSQAERTQMVRQLQDLSARHQPDGDRGRPLTRVLAELGLD